MRYIDINEAKDGMQLASDLFDSYGHTLISEKSYLSDKMLEKLKRLGIDGLYIEDKYSEGIKIEPVIPQKLKATGMAAVKIQDVNSCKDVALDIVKQLALQKNVAFDLTDLRTYDDYTYAHSVNVAVLSAVTALGLQLKEEDMVNVIVAGLLHDIGKLDIPPEILNKPERLTNEEYLIMKNHAIYSYEKIKNRNDISAQIKQAVLYHHENIDGSGYPNGVNQSKLSLFARILHVADVYDALVSKRPYKEPYSPYEAAEYLMGGCGAMFDQTVVNAFLRYVPMYPKGTEVMLSNGKEAIIYDNTGARNMRPIVRLKDDCTLLDLWDDEYLNITVVSSAMHGRKMEASERARRRMINPVDLPTVLLVDPDLSNAEMVKLVCDDYEIKTASSAEGAIDYIAHFGFPQILLTEVDLPGMQGVELATRIQKQSSFKVPIIFITTHSDRETVIKCRNINPAGYILKPYKEMFIRSELKRVLSGAADLD